MGRPKSNGKSKHGTDFREGATVFADPLSTTFPDIDHSEHEHRFLTIGQSTRRRILVVAHTEEGEPFESLAQEKRPGESRAFMKKRHTNNGLRPE